MIETTVVLRVLHKRPDPDLAAKIANRAWTMDGVESAFVVEGKSLWHVLTDAHKLWLMDQSK